MSRPDAHDPWLYDRCREVESAPDGYLDLWAREHYKSTIITFAGIIQEILIDPEITVGILSSTLQIARPFLRQIKEELESNKDLQQLFPDVLWSAPRKEAPMWSLDGGLICRRLNNPKESTVAAFGLIDGAPTGMHFNLLVYDDLIDEKLVTSPDMIRKVTEKWELSDNLGAGHVRKWHIGTRYSFADTYGIIMERGVLRPRVYPATDNGKLDGEPVFISVERWEEKKRTQRSTVSAQMLQNPIAGQENVFDIKWFRPWERRPETINVYIMVDPSRGKSATSDRTAIAVVGVDANMNKYLLDGYRHRMSLSERYANVMRLYQKWLKQSGVQSVTVGYERYGQQSDDEYFIERMRKDHGGQLFSMVELAWPREGGASKIHRVERLEPDFRDDAFYLPAIIHHPDLGECLWRVGEDESGERVMYRKKTGLIKVERKLIFSGQKHLLPTAIKRTDEDGNVYDLTRALIEEMSFFPFSPRDDLVDAVSRIYDIGALPPIIVDKVDIEPAGYEDA